MPQGLQLPDSDLARFCQRHHILRLSLFGSVLRGTDRPESDVDLLVEFAPGHTPDFFTLADMEEEFSCLLHGRRVDMRTPRDLSHYFRAEVVASAQVQYAA
ncbi:MAG: nucleotidyltransferase family protein [Magnetococcus sp. DMHC-1]|nr:nucleotidyltransferase family protein [Magnetococcales bacterium]